MSSLGRVCVWKLVCVPGSVTVCVAMSEDLLIFSEKLRLECLAM